MEGDAGKAICKEAERLKPAAVVMGTRGRGIIQRSVILPLSCKHAHKLTHVPVPYSVLVCICHDMPYLLVIFHFSVLQGSVSEYCFHNCKAAPVIIVPGTGIICKLPCYFGFL